MATTLKSMAARNRAATRATAEAHVESTRGLELERVDPLTTLREQEYAYFAGDDFPAMLASRAVTLA